MAGTSPAMTKCELRFNKNESLYAAVQPPSIDRLAPVI
jgi:hypothetical protein